MPVKPKPSRLLRHLAVLVLVVGAGLALGLGAVRFVTQTDGSTDRALTRWVEVCTQTGTYLISVAVGRPAAPPSEPASR